MTTATYFELPTIIVHTDFSVGFQMLKKTKKKKGVKLFWIVLERHDQL